MNVICCASLALILVAAAPARGEDAPAREWHWRPALYALATFDDTSGQDTAFFNGALREPSPGLGLGATLDSERQWSRGSLETNLVLLTRSPQADDNRSLSFAGRVHATRELGGRWRLALTDSAKLQRQARGFATDFERNHLQLDARWLGGRSWDLGAHVTDRRRSVAGVPALGFDYQSGAFDWFLRPARLLSLRFEGGLQRYHAPTATGQRWQWAFEAARVHTTGVVALRALWLEPRTGRGGAAAAASVPGVPTTRPPEPTTGSLVVQNVVNAAAQGAFLENVTNPAPTALSGEDVLSDALWLDPLEEDADEWDFGQRKQAVVAFGSRRLGERAALSARVSLVARRGPDLLQPTESTAEHHERRFELRTGARLSLTRGTALLVQGSYLDSSGDRPALEFHRLLAAVGVQLRF
jgi:hypothetical protein